MKRYPLLLLLLLFHLLSCTKDGTSLNFPPEKKTEMISGAQKLFNDCKPVLTRSDCDDDVFNFSPGESEVDWSSSDYFENIMNGFCGIESVIDVTYEFRAIMPDSTIIWCDRELMYLKDDITGAESLFMVYYLPTADYAYNCDEDLGIRFDNSGNMGNYSGLKIYNTLDGATVRINEYCDGQCVNGLYLRGLDSDSDLTVAYSSLLSMLGNVTIQKVIAPIETRVFHQAVNVVQELTFREIDGDSYNLGEIDAAIVIGERGHGGSSTISASDYESYLWMLACAQKDAQFGNNDPGDAHNNIGGSSDATDSSDDKKNKEEESLDQVRERLHNMVVNSSEKGCAYEGLNALLDELIDLAASNSVLLDVLRATTVISKIEIVDLIDQEGKETQPETRREKGSKKPTRIVFPYDQIDTPNAIYKIMEEAFHVAQQVTYEGWGDGDLELEAKVFLCLLWEQLGSDKDHYPFVSGNNIEYDVTVLLDFYAERASFYDAKEALDDLGYNESKFHFSGAANDNRFKHIEKYSEDYKFVN